ncbi:MAG: patatin-like phospholipase family protein [Betaproteobacteria bacterium]|nr:patatin-like phospholipase family protein [Betaproteobacteria bacterium]
MTRIATATALVALAALACSGLAGCAGSPEHPPTMPTVRDAIYDTSGPGHSRSVDKGSVGVALAGGGTKAAAYGMGVLAAISDANMYGEIDAISTVSGGGYAAFFLYSKVLLREDAREADKPQIRDFFADCIPHVYASVLPATAANRLCAPPSSMDAKMERFRFQQFVRCRQDVLENDCSHRAEGDDHGEYVNTGALVAASALTFVPNFVARTLFDWPVNLSPTRHAYMQGIGTTYGLYPRTARAAEPSADLSDRCDDAHFLNCDMRSGSARLNPRGLEFGDLKAHLKKPGAEPMPTWLINATASRSRSIFGWAREGRRDFGKYTLQMSPYLARSGLYGRIDRYAEYLDLLGATTAAAAFLDSNQTGIAQPWRMGLALAQHAFAFDWGVDIPNPNVGNGWRALHVALPLWPWPWTKPGSIPNLPFPTYFADGGLRQLGESAESGRRPDGRRNSAYIRLLDGGNNDDLGAYSLLEAGIRHVVIADHAQDGKGQMGDLCLLHNEVRLRMATKHLVVPGRESFAEFCAKDVAESECGDRACAREALGLPAEVAADPDAEAMKRGYPIKAWSHPVLLACVRDLRQPSNPDQPCQGEVDAWIYVVKPALDLHSFIEKYIDGHLVLEKARAVHFADKGETDLAGACDKANGSLCEVAAYVAALPFGKDEMSRRGPFPQHTTVGMTFASDGMTYGAYRELARWQAGVALRWIGKDRQALAAEAARQGAAPIPLVPLSR